MYLGHPSQTEFLRILRLVGAATEVLAFAWHRFHCPVCASTSRLAVHREAEVPITYEFNNIVAVDLFILDLMGDEVQILSDVDHYTSFQWCG